VTDLPFTNLPCGTTPADIDRLMESDRDDNPWDIDEPREKEETDDERP
jgi:hypothetical protein